MANKVKEIWASGKAVVGSRTLTILHCASPVVTPKFTG